MPQWEYMTISWLPNKGVFIWPNSGLPADWLQTVLPRAKVDEVKSDLAYAGLPVPLAWRVYMVHEGYAAALILRQLGAQGWELVRVEGRIVDRPDASAPAGGEAWLKRPSP